MATEFLRGTKVPLLQAFVRKWSPTNGYTEEATYRGFDTERMRQLSSYMSRNGFEYEWITEHGMHVLHAVDTSGANTIDTWEIAINKLQPSTFKNPLNLANVSSANLKDIRAMDQRDEGFSYDQTVAKIIARNDSTKNAALRMAQRVNEGSDSYTYSGYVLRHTTNVSNRYRRNVSDVGVDRLYTKAALLSETTNTRFWVYPLPGRLQWKTSAIHDQFSSIYTSRDGYVWSWLKSGSTETTAANNRVNITTEYEFGNWSTDEYILS